MKKTRFLGSIILSALFILGYFPLTEVRAQATIQTQSSSDGTLEADLVEAKANGEVLTVKVMIKNPSADTINLKIDYRNAYYTDLKEKKKYFGLKDAEGAFIAGPKYDSTDGGRFWSDLKAGEKKILWIKFPAPPAATANIDVFIPEILPFENIAIQK